MFIRRTLSFLMCIYAVTHINAQMERIFEQNPSILDQQAGTHGKILIQSELKIDVLHEPEDCDKKGRDGETLMFNYEAGINGEIIENSYMTGNEEEDKEKEPLVVPLGRKAVIQGLELGVQKMCVGEKRKIVIPPHLAFGSKGVPGTVPPDAYVTFIVELMEIIPKGWGEWYIEMVWLACYVSFIGGILTLAYQKVQERKKERRKKNVRTKYDDYQDEHED